MTHDTSHVTPDMTCDKWLGVNILSKFQLPSRSYSLAVMMFEGLEEKYYQMNKSVITKVFVEQPRLHRVC